MMLDIEQDTWLETVSIHEEPCRYIDCTKLATHLAIMSKPCEHLWMFCLEHKAVTAALQKVYAGGGGQWECRVGSVHYVGLVVRWESVR